MDGVDISVWSKRSDGLKKAGKLARACFSLWSWMALVPKASKKEVSCVSSEISFSFNRFQICLRSGKMWQTTNDLREDPKKRCCWKLYGALFKSNEARVYLFAPTVIMKTTDCVAQNRSGSLKHKRTRLNCKVISFNLQYCSAKSNLDCSKLCFY